MPIRHFMAGHKKASRTLGFVKRNIKTKNQSVKKLAYKALVRHQVEYASTVWSPFTKQNIRKSGNDAKNGCQIDNK